MAIVFHGVGAGSRIPLTSGQDARFRCVRPDGTALEWRVTIVVAYPSKNSDQYPPFTDKYDVERVLGRGGMGTVFEARHSRLGHRVAIKVLGEDFRSYPELVKRFEREAKAAGELSSPHAVRVFDIDQTDDGTPFMVMELLEGHDLAHLIEREGPQPIGRAIRWVIDACAAIGEAHALGIIHRDIKPSNLFLCSDTDAIKVLDFGIAKRVAAKESAITLGVAPLGTPQYMSPEQIRAAKDVDPRSDIWSLGITLYELVCGRTPFNYEVPQACIAAIVADPVPDPREFRPDMPDEIAAVIMRALEKDPERRYGSVEDLVTALAPFAEFDGDDPILELEALRRKAKFTPTEPSRASNASLLSVAPAGLPGRRSRSKFALAAAVLGFTALVATPRSLRARLEAVSTASVKLPPQVGEVALKAASIRVGAVEGDPAPVEAAAESEAPEAPLETDAADADLGKDLVPTSLDTAATLSPPRPTKTVNMKSSTASSAKARVGGPVHGGISSPGF